MKRRTSKLLSILLALCMVLSLLPGTAWADDNLTQLGTPTELQWGVTYDGNGQGESIPGYISWKIGTPNQNQFEICIYRDGEAENPVESSTWDFGARDDSEYRSVDNFLRADLDSGTYYFTVQALGDGETYSDSEIAQSETWSYTKPSTQLPQVKELSWDWPDVTWADLDNVQIRTYDIAYLFASSTGDEPYHIGGTSGMPSDVTRDTIIDEYVQRAGPGYYYFQVRALSADITAIQNGPWSDLSDAYNLADVSDDVKDALDSITTDNAQASDIREAVQKIERDDLRSAMLADKGEEDGVIDRLSELEEAAGGPADVTVTDAFEDFDEGDISIVGAAFNKTDDGDKITLEVGKAKEEHVIEELYDSTLAVSFSLDLKVNDGYYTEELKVPIQITLPIPSNINPQFLVILHYAQNGDVDVIEPYIFQTGTQWFASFVLDHFSDFVMTVTTGNEGDDDGDGDTSTPGTGNNSSSSSSSSTSVSSPQTSGSTTTVGVTTSSTTSGTTARATVSSTNMDKAVKSAVTEATEQGTAPVVEVEIKTAASADSLSVTLPAASLEKLAGAENSSLVIVSDIAEVALDNTALGALAEQATGSTVVLNVAPVAEDSLTADQKETMSGDENKTAVVVDLTMTSNGVAISNYKGGILTVTLPYELPSGSSAADVKVYYLADDGSVEQCTASYKDGKVTFTTSHLSNYVITTSILDTILSFIDVLTSDWFYGAVAWAVKNSVTTGTGDGTTFSPDQGCTRAQFVTFLWRAANKPEPTGSVNPFSDVSQTRHADYYKAILWASEQGIANGTGDGTTFSPDAVVTRAQSVTFMHRYAQKAGIATETGTATFDDVNSEGALTPYYDAIGWAVANGITNGNSTTQNTFGPMDNCIRSQMITFLYRLFTDATA